MKNKENLKVFSDKAKNSIQKDQKSISPDYSDYFDEKDKIPNEEFLAEIIDGLYHEEEIELEKGDYEYDSKKDVYYIEHPSSDFIEDYLSYRDDVEIIDHKGSLITFIEKV